MDNFTKKQQIGILILVIFLVFMGKSIISKKVVEKEVEDKIEVSKEEGSKNEDIKVHIKGAVKNPGVYDMKKDSRIDDLVKKSGGFLENSDINKVFLAKKVKDEETIHIPFIGETEDVENGNTSFEEGKVNINLATKEELQKLNGVGEATADKIIEYRKTEKFQNIEDIMNVSGIGEKKFENIKENIIVW